MKKNSVIKAILFTFLAYVLLSWIIPGGTFSGSNYTKGVIAPVGLSDLFIHPILTASTSIFVLVGLVILLIGGLYGVINKTGVYQKLVDGVVKKFTGKEKVFLIISILVFAILASLTTLTLPLLIMVPFFVAVILLLGYNRMTALLSTVGAILVGNMGSVFGYNAGGYNYIYEFFKVKTTDNIIAKIVLFVLLLVCLLIFVIKTSKIEKVGPKKGRKTTKKKEAEEEVKEEIVVPLYKKVEESKKSTKPLYIVMIITLIIALVGMYCWTGLTNKETSVFIDAYQKIADIKFNGQNVLANLIGSVNPFGHWTNYELAMLIIITTIVIGFVYNLKVKETFEAFVEGMKEMLPVAAVAILANILLLVVNTVSSVFFVTIFDFFFGLCKNAKDLGIAINSFIGSVGYNDFTYLMNILQQPASALYAKDLPHVVYIMQSMFGFAMMIFPTSMVLVIGLQYLNISFKEWFKENWKLLLGLLLVAIVSIIIFGLI